MIRFEEEIAELFNNAQIYAPIHLYYGNEEQIIEVFKNVRPKDWVFCSWRSHYQCLLKGVPCDDVKREILEGRSISLCFPDHRVYSSALVGGCIPVAVGMAMAIKRTSEDAKVWCFMGEMTSETGIAHECIKYSLNHGLPIVFVFRHYRIFTLAIPVRRCRKVPRRISQTTLSFTMAPALRL